MRRAGEMRIGTQFWSENLKGRDHFSDPGSDARIILK
jgi:hypothetical protein